ncbi:hypothetical protein FGRMN_2953 [Fusarium graminum]|nr:hypothetical protein FGRMN_2953 [Fusarium graminum]
MANLALSFCLEQTNRECKTRSQKEDQEKEEEGEKKTESSTESLPRYRIEIKDFIPLAECTSAYKKLALCSKAFSITPSRIPSVRSSSSAELYLQNAKPNVKADTKHFYIVGILEKVCEALKPFADPVASISGAIDIMTNQFDGFEGYEPSEKFLNALDAQKPVTTAQDTVAYEVELSQSFDEALIAFYMMCEDIDRIRHFVADVWDGLAKEDESLYPAVLVVVINTAFEFGKGLIDEMMPVIEAHGDAIYMPQAYTVRIQNLKGKNPPDCDVWNKDDKSRAEYYSTTPYC